VWGTDQGHPKAVVVPEVGLQLGGGSFGLHLCLTASSGYPMVLGLSQMVVVSPSGPRCSFVWAWELSMRHNSEEGIDYGFELIW
jgi:hypothetical protein